MASPTSQLSPTMIRVIDVGGLVVSSLCAVHCALTPVVLVVLPFLGWQSLEWPFRLGAVVVGVTAIGLGAAFHRNRAVVRPLLIGIGLIGVASLVHWAIRHNHGSVQAGGSLFPESGVAGVSALVLEVMISIAASTALIRAHWLNSKACSHACHDCPPARTIAALPWPGEATPGEDSNNP